MFRDHLLVRAGVIVDSISILWRLSITKRVTILPEQIACNTISIKSYGLPCEQESQVRVIAVFFEDAGLVD
jgi:hypothetical protein